MIYHPQKYPKKAFALITGIVLLGILGGYFLHEWFIAGALIFWIHYTIVLSYLQFKKKSKHSYKGFTNTLLHPQIRFFLFEAAATIGLLATLQYRWLELSVISLLVWWLFALDFYVYYNGKYEN